LELECEFILAIVFSKNVSRDPSERLFHVQFGLGETKGSDRLSSSHMKKHELQVRVQAFVNAAKDRLAALPKTEIEAWPNWPEVPPFSLEVPEDLSGHKYTFTVMKDTFPDGRIRLAIQCYRYRFLGYGWMSADGFVLYPDGSRSELSQQDIWDVT
jgi:hypothetical protein